MWFRPWGSGKKKKKITIKKKECAWVAAEGDLVATKIMEWDYIEDVWCARRKVKSSVRNFQALETSFPFLYGTSAVKFAHTSCRSFFPLFVTAVARSTEEEWNKIIYFGLCKRSLCKWKIYINLEAEFARRRCLRKCWENERSSTFWKCVAIIIAVSFVDSVWWSSVGQQWIQLDPERGPNSAG